MYNRVILIPFAALLISSSLDAAERNGGEVPLNETAQMELAKQRELHEIGLELFASETESHAGAVHQLIHLASTYPVMPPDVRDLLIRATGVPDGRLADLAGKALYLFENRETRRRVGPELPDEVLIARAQRRDLEQARQALARASSHPGDRLGAVQTLVHMASSAPALSDEILALLEEVRSNPDFGIAHLAEKTLARRQGRAMAPALVAPVVPSRQQVNYGVGQEPDPFAGLRAELPGTRLAALELILDSALSENRHDDANVIDAFVRLLADSDPRVAHRARNGLLGLAGDKNALADLYVSEEVIESPSWMPLGRGADR